jgi:hypothetical protein
MNKKGHLAAAVLTGSGTALLFPQLSMQTAWLPTVILITASAIGGLAPDIDHKTSTASQMIQFSNSKRKLFRTLSSLFLIIGMVLLFLNIMKQSLGNDIELWLRKYPIGESYPIWIGGGILTMLLAKLRTLVLTGAGALMLYGYAIYDWHWIAVFAGISLIILPLLSHRGLIHTPEFALLLSFGLLSVSQYQAEWIACISIGFIVGWWTHLFADCFGSEGIHSQIFPKIKVALRLFHNGGVAERLISRGCWIGSILIWSILFIHIPRGIPVLWKLL